MKKINKNDEWLQEYIEDIHSRTVKEVKNLLRCLLVPINRKLDISNYETFVFMKQSKDTQFVEMANEMSENECYYRIENGQDAWEGLTWVLELLPSRPYKAIKALETYLLAQSNLPDDRVFGIEQCAEIIMAKFIDFENPLEKLTNLKPIEFEWLIDELYESMGYETTWTPSTRDGGKDIIARIKRTDGNEIVYVECKLYKTTKLKIEVVRNLGYVMFENKVNRGVIFCTGYVNENIKKLDNRIQIWSYEEIKVLLNAHLGSEWVNRLDILLDNKRRKYKKLK
jgi:restriction system protein